jgi:hypothetical protein
MPFDKGYEVGNAEHVVFGKQLKGVSFCRRPAK